MSMNLVIGTDHRGFAHKEYIKRHTHLDSCMITWLDVGADTAERSDYPIFALRACELIKSGKASQAVLLCASGVGMAVVANRFSQIYAAVAWNEEIARLCKEDDNINVLVVPADFVTQEQAVLMIALWLTAHFKQGRYQERRAMIDALGGL